MLIKRDIDAFFEKRMFAGKALVVYGPRQAGKTTAVENYLRLHGLDSEVVFFNGDETADRETLADASAERISILVGKKKILFIDEAHKIPEIGLVMKRAFDRCKGLQIVATGSSSVELAEKIEEPMTGRKFEYALMPLSFAELAANATPADEMRAIERRLVFGCYPDIVVNPGDEVERLRELGKGYLYKDVFKYGELRKPEVLDRLVRALAFQVGQEVSYSELARTVGADDKTVADLIGVLEKAYVVRKVPSYARNLRNELKKAKKVYFVDCGIRNCIIGDWRTIGERGADEAGRLWENYLFSERFKWRLLHERDTREFFWRTSQQQEVDMIEAGSFGLRAFEFKWNSRRAGVSLPKTFVSAYPEAACRTVVPGNVMEFLMA